MPELRKDPVVGRWVIISTERGKRPTDYRQDRDIVETATCPFCPGNEAMTPPEIFVERDRAGAPNSPGWSVRAFANKFPALRIEGEINRQGDGIYDKMNGIGAHEVIVETPDHHQTIADLGLDQFTLVLKAYVDRIEDLKRDKRFRYVLIFKNQGKRAGASLEHSHTQLIATPIVPIYVKDELDGSEQHFKYKERCVFCDIIRQELNDGRRVVADNGAFLALEPFAPRFPFETWILPKRHSPMFEDHKDDLRALAAICKEALQRLNKSLDSPPYNYFIHNSPFISQVHEFYHWHIEIMPRITRTAGFERGSGFYINPTPPEDAAQYLRSIEL